ncbi:MAG: hypothetical protein JNK76_06630 [Planctomycetales bacterium]|nr:hypothetical protein [Planctomycetales bacterium]MBN8625822.1 hypothetical protein [Planctomycetota bacterium]
MELHEALGQLEVIRRQMARSETFDGYRVWPTAIGALLACGAAALQPWLVPQPAVQLDRYLLLWVGTAAVAGCLAAGDALRRHRGTSTLHGTLTRLAIEQFVPCVVAGGALTAAVAYAAPAQTWLLPGLWSILFSLGLFASARLLPRLMLVPAAWYLTIGCVCIALGPERAGLAPWTMAATFGFGQASVALVLAMQQADAISATEETR